MQQIAEVRKRAPSKRDRDDDQSEGSKDQTGCLRQHGGRRNGAQCCSDRPGRFSDQAEQQRCAGEEEEGGREIDRRQTAMSHDLGTEPDQRRRCEPPGPARGLGGDERVGNRAENQEKNDRRQASQEEHPMRISSRPVDEVTADAPVIRYALRRRRVRVVAGDHERQRREGVHERLLLAEKVEPAVNEFEIPGHDVRRLVRRRAVQPDAPDRKRRHGRKNRSQDRERCRSAHCSLYVWNAESHQ